MMLTQKIMQSTRDHSGANSKYISDITVGQETEMNEKEPDQITAR